MINKYRVRLVGVTPLLMHWDNIEWSDAMDEWKNDPKNKKFSKAGDDRTPAFRWIGSIYQDGNNVCMLPENISRCVMDAGAMVLVPGGKSGKSFKSQTQSGMKVDDPFIQLTVKGKLIPWPPIAELRDVDEFGSHVETVRRMGFKLFIKRAKIGATKHIRVRPMFESWELEFGISVWDKQLTKDVLTDIYEQGGAYKGLGDWRPSGRTPGSYGMFALDTLTAA